MVAAAAADTGMAAAGHLAAAVEVLVVEGSEVVVQGNDEEVNRLQKALDLREKGMVYVKGVLE